MEMVNGLSKRKQQQQQQTVVNGSDLPDELFDDPKQDFDVEIPGHVMKNRKSMGEESEAEKGHEQPYAETRSLSLVHLCPPLAPPHEDPAPMDLEKDIVRLSTGFLKTVMKLPQD